MVHEARYSVDATFEVDTVHDTHEVHVFVGSRRVATSKRTGLGNGIPTGSVTQVTFYHPDQVGTNSVTTTTTASSQSVSRAYLDPFGDKQAGTGSDPRHLFTDQERDAETGLDYFGARYYDAWVGRFLEQDPDLLGDEEGITFGRIEEDAGNQNAYAYVLNRPTRLIDPTGAFPCEMNCWRPSGSNSSGPNPTAEPTIWVVIPVNSAVTSTPPPGPNPLVYAALIVLPDGSVPGQDETYELESPVSGPVVGLSKAAARLLGPKLVPHARKTLAEAIRSRGGTAAVVRHASSHLQQQTLGQVAELAAKGEKAARDAIKLVKEAARLGAKTSGRQ